MVWTCWSGVVVWVLGGGGAGYGLMGWEGVREMRVRDKGERERGEGREEERNKGITPSYFPRPAYPNPIPCHPSPFP